jgi:S-adenosylmethionine:tRNA ribosyltransferase-isomerase
MKLSDFDYELPELLIAQHPLKDRTASRLMAINKHSGERQHLSFPHIIDLLEQGDTLVLNDTRVIPARLFGVKEDTGAHIEVLLLTEHEKDTWQALVKPAKRIKKGSKIIFGDGLLTAECLEEEADGGRRLFFSYEGLFQALLDQLGQMPLPPYIKAQLEDKERYQTVFAKHHGSVAAPTAGLHFTHELLERAQQKGIQVAYVTLHVGLGTFRPVQTEQIEAHRMHSEYYLVSEETAALLNQTQRDGGRIIAVGTTSCRTLESAVNERGVFEATAGWTDIFIYPGYQFKAIDGLITNFHLPKSTLLMLVSALASREIMLEAYREAVAEQYRFFSFGDAMIIL